MLAEAEISTIR